MSSSAEEEDKSTAGLIPPELLREMGERFGVMDANRNWTIHHGVHNIADELGIPFMGLVPDPDQAGAFKLWVPPSNRPKTRSTLRTHQNVPLRYDELATVPVRVLIEDSDTTKVGTKLGSNEDWFRPNSGRNEALVLFTSGTTGNKKLVPHEIGDILTAAMMIALSWELLQPHGS